MVLAYVVCKRWVIGIPLRLWDAIVIKRLNVSPLRTLRKPRDMFSGFYASRCITTREAFFLNVMASEHLMTSKVLFSVYSKCPILMHC